MNTFLWGNDGVTNIAGQARIGKQTDLVTGLRSYFPITLPKRSIVV